MNDNILKGSAASQGNYKGTARVIIDAKDFAKLNPGEILVTKQTSPAWTPLFAAAGAVVTQLGGILSHAAIVSREYGIPAVVGVKNATAQIKDGQLIEVDGTKGIVTLVN